MNTVLKGNHSCARKCGFKKLLFSLTAIFAVIFIISLTLFFSFKDEIYFTLSITFGVTFYHFAIRLVIGYFTDKIFVPANSNVVIPTFKFGQEYQFIYQGIGRRQFLTDIVAVG